MPNFIDRETHEQANQKLPDIDRLTKRIACLTVDFISIKYKPESNFPIAGACFQDASRTLAEARYALLESFAHKIWYLEKMSPPNEFAAVFFGRFYADDAALRLYSAAEHLAKAAVYIFDIADDKIVSNRTGSRFTTVRKILLQEQPTHLITSAIDELHNSNEWQDTIGYRNTWVHQQPPIVEGLGTAFTRERRWKKSEASKGYALGIGGGDEPEYSIDDLLGFIRPALFQFTDKLTQISEFYIAELEKKGLTINETEMGLQTRYA